MGTAVLRFRGNLWVDCDKLFPEILFGVILGRQYAQKKWLSCPCQEKMDARGNELCCICDMKFSMSISLISCFSLLS